jgi:nitrous oxidase accessory protein
MGLISGSDISAQEAGFDLQAAIDAARPGDTIQIPPGLYQGNFVIEKSLTLVGVNWPVLDGGEQGNVVEINNADNVTLRGLVILNSGARLDKENAGIAVDKSPHFVAENNRLDNTLFGIYIKDSPESRIAGNIVGAKNLDVPDRGDGIRVWYSRDTQVIGNRVDRGRDVVLWYNNGAVIRDNIITNGRYGLHFMYCDDNLVEGNRLEGNSVGAFLMYSRRLTLRHNIFANNRGPSGYGIGLKDLDGVEATDNLFTSNRVGMYFDNSPASVDVSQHIRHNAFTYNDIGLLFTPSVKRNYFSQNSFIENLEQVSLTGGGTFAGNGFTVEGRGNFWSDYTGYDAAGDGLGDLPYVSKSLFENMMDKNPHLRLFQLSPAQQAIDLAARAFPIFQSQPKFSDDNPLMQPVRPAITLPPTHSTGPMWVLALILLAFAGAVAGTIYLPRVMHQGSYFTQYAIRNTPSGGLRHD